MQEQKKWIWMNNNWIKVSINKMWMNANNKILNAKLNHYIYIQSPQNHKLKSRKIWRRMIQINDFDRKYLLNLMKNYLV